jgi:hypothetical protein
MVMKMNESGSLTKTMDERGMKRKSQMKVEWLKMINE